MELIVYPKGNNPRLINPSPFCAKTEIMFRFFKLKFELNEYRGNPGKFEKKKLPVLIDDGSVIGDSSFILEHIVKKFNLDLDSHLSEMQWAEGFAFQKMIEEFFYWSLLYERWFIDQNWEKLRDQYFGHFPAPIRKIVASLIRSSSKKSAIGHGMARHKDEDVLRFGKLCLKSISIFLDQKRYLLGEKISSFDFTVFAFVASIIHSPLGPVLAKEVRLYSNLMNYDERLYKEIFNS